MTGIIIILVLNRSIIVSAGQKFPIQHIFPGPVCDASKGRRLSTTEPGHILCLFTDCAPLGFSRPGSGHLRQTPQNQVQLIGSLGVDSAEWHITLHVYHNKLMQRYVLYPLATH